MYKGLVQGERHACIQSIGTLETKLSCRISPFL